MHNRNLQRWAGAIMAASLGIGAVGWWLSASMSDPTRQVVVIERPATDSWRQCLQGDDYDPKREALATPTDPIARVVIPLNPDLDHDRASEIVDCIRARGHTVRMERREV